MGYFYINKKGPFIPVLAGMLTYLMNYLIIFLISVFVFGFNFSELIDASLDNMVSMNEQFTNFIQVPLDENQLSLYKEYMEMVASLLPFFMIASSVIMAGLHHFVNRIVLHRMGYHEVEKLPPFRTWTFPKAVLFYYLISLFILLLGIIDRGSDYYSTFLNLHTILEMMIYIQGLAVIAYFSRAKKMGPMLPIIAVVLTFFIPPVGMLIVRLVGILELGFQIRNRIN